ncbi:hypothetical protein DYB37_007923 [Aphanomyces astaci]|uniref:Golgin-84 n=1 Tax=Aphanomyces astaci TaxID=112090 RepID=A0A3R6YF43_APHAT|nr:hypothetical protein DYB37_007923 [Aphanomyces astaci]
MNSKSKFTRFSEENMSWLSNSLQLAGELLESVDQKASGKLKQRGGTTLMGFQETTLMDHMPRGAKETKAGLRNDLSAVERQLANSTEQLAVCQDELEALDKECTDKITSLERQIGQLGCDKAADEAHFVAALGVKDAHVLTLEGELTASKHVIQAYIYLLRLDLTTLMGVTSYTQLDGDGCTSGEAQLEQRVASLLAELTEASAAHVQLKKEYADSKQSMYARQCALEATNAELTTQVATLQQASTKPTVSEASHHAAVLSLQKELHEARTARPSAGAAPVLTTTTAAVPDGQMQAMTRRLLEKQEQLDAVRSRYTTLEVRFNDLKAAKDAQDKNDDLELNIRTGRTPRGGHHGLRPRHAPHKIAAVEAADRWLLSVGRFLRAYPEARLGLLGYLVLLHLWAFVILGFHTSHLSDEVKAKATP